jgi:hypothetical protein
LQLQNQLAVLLNRMAVVLNWMAVLHNQMQDDDEFEDANPQIRIQLHLELTLFTSRQMKNAKNIYGDMRSLKNEEHGTHCTSTMA